MNSVSPLPALADALKGRLAARRALRTARVAGWALAPRVAYRRLVRSLSIDCTSVLDVGTGLMHSLEDSPCPIKIGLDVHRPYLLNRRVSDAIPLNAAALSIEQLFVPGAVDLVTMIDVLEHLDLDGADELLRQAESIAARRVVVFTPRGVFPQAGYDAFGLGGEEFQRHRSSWEVESFASRGYRVIVLEGFHGPWNESFVRSLGPGGTPVDALLAFKDLDRTAA